MMILGWRMNVDPNIDAILLYAWGISPTPLSTYRYGVSPQTPHDDMNLPNLSTIHFNLYQSFLYPGTSLPQSYWQLQMTQAIRSIIFLLFLVNLDKNSTKLFSRFRLYYFRVSALITPKPLSNYLVEFISYQTPIYCWQRRIRMWRDDKRCFFSNRDRLLDQKIFPLERGTSTSFPFSQLSKLFINLNSMYLSMSACFRHSHARLLPIKKLGSMSMLYPLSAFFSFFQLQNYSFDF